MSGFLKNLREVDMVQLVLEHNDCNIHRYSVKCRTVNNPTLRSTAFFPCSVIREFLISSPGLNISYLTAARFGSISQTHAGQHIKAGQYRVVRILWNTFEATWSVLLTPALKWISTQINVEQGTAFHINAANSITVTTHNLVSIWSQSQKLIIAQATFTNRNTQYTKHSSPLKANISD
jgi:hypothetical protein